MFSGKLEAEKFGLYAAMLSTDEAEAIIGVYVDALQFLLVPMPNQEYSGLALDGTVDIIGYIGDPGPPPDDIREKCIDLSKEYYEHVTRVQ